MPSPWVMESNPQNSKQNMKVEMKSTYRMTAGREDHSQGGKKRRGQNSHCSFESQNSGLAFLAPKLPPSIYPFRWQAFWRISILVTRDDDTVATPKNKREMNVRRGWRILIVHFSSRCALTWELDICWQSAQRRRLDWDSRTLGGSTPTSVCMRRGRGPPSPPSLQNCNLDRNRNQPPKS